MSLSFAAVNQPLDVSLIAGTVIDADVAFLQEVLGKHPGAFSPPTQTNGESSDALARKHIDDCITNGSARFDWLACDPAGRRVWHG